MRHEDIGWSLVTIERGAAEETVKVPAGSFETIVYTVRPKDGRVGRFDIEAAEPHRVIRWEWTPPASAAAGREHFMGGTDRGELTGAKRLEYWNLHDPGDEKYLEDLGLHPVMK